MKLKKNSKKALKVKHKTKNEPSMILYKPTGEKVAHIFQSWFKGGVGKTLCGRTIFALALEVTNQGYKASEHCPRCEEALRVMEEHKLDRNA